MSSGTTIVPTAPITPLCGTKQLAFIESIVPHYSGITDASIPVHVVYDEKRAAVVEETRRAAQSRVETTAATKVKIAQLKIRLEQKRTALNLVDPTIVLARQPLPLPVQISESPLRWSTQRPSDRLPTEATQRDVEEEFQWKVMLVQEKEANALLDFLMQEEELVDEATELQRRVLATDDRLRRLTRQLNVDADTAAHHERMLHVDWSHLTDRAAGLGVPMPVEIIPSQRPVIVLHADALLDCTGLPQPTTTSEALQLLRMREAHLARFQWLYDKRHAELDARVEEYEHTAASLLEVQDQCFSREIQQQAKTDRLY